jgi:hypothetical protein
VWRGYELSEDSIVIQPSVSAGYKGFGFNLWGNLDTDASENIYDYSGSQFNETDMTLSYDTSVGPVALGVGYIYYGFDYGDDTEEIYISFGFDTILSPTLTIYRDIAEFYTWYVALDIGYSFEMPNDITLDLGGSFGYYYDDDNDYSELHNGLLSVGLTIPVGEYMSIAPSIAYSFPLSSDAEDTLAGVDGDSNFFYGGVTCSISF